MVAKDAGVRHLRPPLPPLPVGIGSRGEVPGDRPLRRQPRRVLHGGQGQHRPGVGQETVLYAAAMDSLPRIGRGGGVGGYPAGASVVRAAAPRSNALEAPGNPPPKAHHQRQTRRHGRPALPGHPPPDAQRLFHQGRVHPAQRPKQPFPSHTAIPSFSRYVRRAFRLRNREDFTFPSPQPRARATSATLSPYQ